MNEINYKERATELKRLILHSNDLPVEEVKVPEWDLPFPIYIRTMDGKDKDEFETERFLLVDGIKSEKQRFKVSLQNLRAATLARVMCADPEGKVRIFEDEEDIIKLGNKSSAALDRCLDVSRRLNGTTKEDEENLVKNLKGQEESSG